MVVRRKRSRLLLTQVSFPFARPLRVALVSGLCLTAPLVGPTVQAQPMFGSINPFGLSDVGNSSIPSFADLDGDGDFDAFVGEKDGNLFYFQNTGSMSSPAFAAPQTNPFGFTDVGLYNTPVFADLDGDGDLDALIGERYGSLFYFQNTGSTSSPAFAAPVSNPFGLSDVGLHSRPAFADLDGDGDFDALIGDRGGNLFYFQNTGSTNSPAFAAPQTNPFGLSDVGSTSRPAFADIDGDGDFDALIGEYDGNLIYFQNTGTSSAPAFAPAQTNPFGLSDVGFSSFPSFADLDGDGDFDAFVGEKDGNLIYFQNTGSTSSPAFAAPQTNPFGFTDVGLYNTPVFADLDGDGDLDALVGEISGNSSYFENTGSTSSPAFAAPQTNPFGLTDVGRHSRPAFADIDCDGDFDAFIGENGGDFLYFQNTGSAAAPAFAAPLRTPFGLSDVSGRNRPAFADIDGDGDFDALVGEYDGNLIYFQNTGSISSPAFAAPQTNPFGLTDVGYANSPAFADLDGDGDFDALVGEYYGALLYFQNSDPNPKFPVALKVILAGGFNGGTMRTDLQTDGFLPLAQPFNTTPWNYTGGETVGAVPTGVTDWVLITLRTGDPNSPPMTNVSQRAAFVKSDGTIVDLDGTSPLTFAGLGLGNYYVMVQHRSHLAVLSASGRTLGAGGLQYNFKTGQAQAFGTNAMRDLGSGVFGMHSGDGDKNGSVSAFDFLTVWLPDNGSSPGYKQSDFNLDGNITAFDFLLAWLPSNGQSTQAPE